MKQIFRRSWFVLGITLLFLLGIVFFYLRLAFKGDDWATYPTNKHIYKNGVITKAGDITDTNGVILAKTENGERNFNEDKNIRLATVHAVGDIRGYISTGVHSAFLDELCGYDIVNGTYNLSGQGNNIQLTLDSDLCVTALNALGNDSGTVGIYNYKTGEIVCMVSTPTFDPASDTISETEGVYVNKFISGTYTPGSIFKVVTTLSALENLKDARTMRFECKRGVTLYNEWLSCMGYHNNTTLEKALIYSCNAFFAQTAIKLGRSEMTKTANKVGFNKTLKMDGIKCAESRYVVKKSNDIDFGWSGIGQHNDIVNPYQYMRFMGAIANDGKAVEPYLIKKIESPGGTTLKKGKIKKDKLLSRENSEIITDMMRQTVVKNYGDWRFSGLSVCGKTGTAEIGKKASPHSWFVGFCDNEDFPYAFAVVVEKAGSGSGVATNVASKVLKQLK